ncbi:uncharacterized protein VP01_1185g3, partial [Puccinia sorghi]
QNSGILPILEHVSNTTATRSHGRSQGWKHGCCTKESATERVKQSWTCTKKKVQNSQLNLIVDWLTAEGNYCLWRSTEMSKRDVCNLILIKLTNHRFKHQKCEWKGVEQMVSALLFLIKFHDALDFKYQKGKGILEKAETQHQELVEEGNKSGERPRMGDCPLATPLEISEQGSRSACLSLQ